MMKSKRQIYNEIDALNFSKGKLYLRSPLAAHYHYPESEGSAEQMLGLLTHAVLLEGMDLGKCIAVKPKGISFASNEGKAWRAAQTKPIVSQEDCASIYGMVGALLDRKEIRNILSTCIRREVIYTKSIYGVPCKALVDSIGRTDDGEDVIMELKTTADCRPDFMSKRIVSEPYHYDLQAAWYRELANCKISSWIVVENKPPFDVALYFPGEAIRNSGENKLRKVLALHRNCTEKDIFPGAQPEPMVLDAPRWYTQPQLTPPMSELELLK